MVPTLHRRQRGFTLLELLVVVAIVAIGSAGVALALRDTGQAQLGMEAQRLAAVLESARAQARTMGRPVRWHAVEGGFAFEGLPGTTEVTAWQLEGTTARSTQPDGAVVLGFEPIMAPHTVRLWHLDRPDYTVQIATDGLRPFAITP